MADIIIKKAKDEYSKDIWKWRNDKVTRKMSKNSAYIPWDNHKKWFSEAIKDPNTLFYIGKVGNISIGSIRFVKDQKCIDNYYVNINISPNFRGKGLSKDFLKNGIKRFLSDVNKINILKAEVKNINNKSNKLFLDYGFEKVGILTNGINTFRLIISKT
tara:strand:- start:369 stop:845 length:477 start_codon:yes stop_codon:yes gene_type:complete